MPFLAPKFGFLTSPQVTLDPWAYSVTYRLASQYQDVRRARANTHAHIHTTTRIHCNARQHDSHPANLPTAVKKNKQPTHTPGGPGRLRSWSGPVETDFQGRLRFSYANRPDGNPACASSLPGDDVITVTCRATGRYLFVVQPRSDTCLHFTKIEVFELVNPDSRDCIACEAGKYSAAAASTVCTDCPTGTYSPTVAADTCLSCPAHSSVCVRISVWVSHQHQDTPHTHTKTV
jgi:hypothetical protein